MVKVGAAPHKLLAFYENKTQSILRRYGPGPRVHYHTGLVEADGFDGSGAGRLRELLVLSQEDLLRYATKAWRLDSLKGREILDVGCGLGGGALYLAQEFGARVTALTIAPSHAELVRHFAAQAGVSHLVTPIVGDALEAQDDSQYDAAIAIDSSSSFPRKPWFRLLAKILRPNGRVLIADCVLVDRQYEEPFNSHWCAQIGTLEEYADAARAAGFRQQTLDDVSSQAANFWSLSLSLMRFEEADALSAKPVGRFENSRRMHAMVREGLTTGGLRHLLMGFGFAESAVKSAG